MFFILIYLFQFIFLCQFICSNGMMNWHIWLNWMHAAVCTVTTNAEQQVKYAIFLLPWIIADILHFQKSIAGRARILRAEAIQRVMKKQIFPFTKWLWTGFWNTRTQIWVTSIHTTIIAKGISKIPNSLNFRHNINTFLSHFNWQ